MSDELLRDRIGTILDTLEFSHDRLIRREIDASTCQTHYDWDRLNQAQDAYYAARDEAVAAILELVAEGRKTR